MRKFLIILFSVIVAVLLLVTFLVSPIAKVYIEKKSPEWIGRQITMDKLRANIWLGKLRIVDFHVSESDMKTDFVTFDSLYVDVNLFKLLKKEVCLKHIWLTDLDVKVVQNDSIFNFSDLLELGKSDEAEQDTTPSGWAVALYDIRLHGGVITYTDVKRNSNWELDNLRIFVPGVYFSGKATDVGLTFDLPDGGHITTKLNYEIETNKYNLNLDLAGVNLDVAMPYVQDYLNVKSIGGTLTSNISVEGSLDDITAMNISGQLQVDTLDVNDGENSQLMQLTQSQVKIARVNPFENVYDFDDITIDGLCGNYTLFADGSTTMSRLFKATDSTQTQTDTISEKMVVAVNNDTVPEQPIFVRVKNTIIRNSCATWVDNTLYSPMEYSLTNISANAKEFTLDGTNDITFSADLPNGGKAMAHWCGGLDFTKTNQKLTLSVKNVLLKHFSPYCEYYCGSKIIGGRMAYSTENTILNGKLKGTNKIDIYNCQIGKKNKNLNAEYGNIPLKMGVSLLKDINGKIAFNVPVSGDINSPKFSYGKIVWQTISNLMLKATASPFVALARTMGAGDDGLDAIQIDALQPDFTSEQYDKFAEIVDIINTTSEFKFLLQQQFNLNTTMNTAAVFQLKRDYYKNIVNSASQERLSLTDMEKIKAIKDKDENFLEYVNSIGASGNNLQEQAFNYYGRDSIQSIVMKMAEHRNEILKYYIKQELKVPEENVQVVTVATEDLSAYEGKSQYGVEMEEIEQESAETKELE